METKKEVFKMFFMDNENNAYEVTNASDYTYSFEFDNLKEGNGVLSSNGTWDLNSVKMVVSELPVLQQFKLYERISKHKQFADYQMNTINDCLLYFTSEDNISEVTIDDKLDFNDEFYDEYLNDAINSLKYCSNDFDMFDLLEFLSDNLKGFCYTHIIGWNQGEECLVFNNYNYTYDETSKNYIACILYGGLVEINRLDNNLDFDCTEEVLSNDYDLEYDKDKIINFMDKNYNAKLAKEVVHRQLVLA